jgi:hypothetical protein
LFVNPKFLVGAMVTLKNSVSKQTNSTIQSLESLIRSSGINLKKSGSGRLVGLCPFHQEKTPSFTIYPDDRYYCFGCGEYGDAIDFIRKQRGLSYFEALDLLGKERPRSGYKARQEYLRKRHEKLKLSWRESDLAWTLGKLIRLGHKALKGLMPTNFSEYCEILDHIVSWERWHDILILGSPEDKKAVMDDLKDFQIFERGRLWRESFDYRAWLREINTLSMPAKKEL